jgi:uncharacterized protein
VTSHESIPQPVSAEEFRLESDEGLPIRCSIDLPIAPRAVVVIIHGFKGFRNWGFFPWLGESFAAAGAAALRFDMSRNGVGESSDTFDRLDLFRDDTYSTQLADLRTVIAHLRRRPDLSTLPLFLFGHSRGGAIAILGAREAEPVAGVLTWAAISAVDRWDEPTRRDWRARGELSVENARTRQIMTMSTRMLEDAEENRRRLDVLGAAEELTAPLLLLHGGRDEAVPVEEARVISRRAENASLVIVGGGSHTFGAIHPLVHVPRELDMAREVSCRFVTSHSIRHHGRFGQVRRDGTGR